MRALIHRLLTDYPDISFVVGPTASWSPLPAQITYTLDGSAQADWTLLHELGHAQLGHANYHNDINLVQKESEAWAEAVMLANKYNVIINNEHMQDSLDTYRDWLHKRSTCPSCGAHGLQTSASRYNCFNCEEAWSVSAARFCRPYRLKIAKEQKTQL